MDGTYSTSGFTRDAAVFFPRRGPGDVSTIVHALLLIAGLLARHYIVPALPEARLAHASTGGLAISSLGIRTHPVLGTYALACPHTDGPNPTILVMLDPKQPLDDGEGIANTLVRHGYAVIVSAGPLPASERVGAMIDAVLAGDAAPPEERGCAPDGRIGLYGIQRGGALVMTVAREREAAGHPVAMVAATLAGTVEPPEQTPAVVIEAAATEHGRARAVVIDELIGCELHGSDDPCWQHVERNPAVRRQLAIDEYVVKLARGTIDHDEFAMYTFHEDVRVAPMRDPGPAELGAPEWRTMYSVPVAVGANFEGNETTKAVLLRPEVLYMRVRDGGFERSSQSLGIGIYGEVGQLGGATEVGGGASFAFASGRLGVVPSVGVTRMNDANGIAGSLFVGLLDCEDLEHNNFATGLRLDARRVGNDTAVTASLQLDLAVPVAAVVAIGMLLDKLDHR